LKGTFDKMTPLITKMLTKKKIRHLCHNNPDLIKLTQKMVLIMSKYCSNKKD
jgi:hypothetical protein